MILKVVTVHRNCAKSRSLRVFVLSANSNEFCGDCVPDTDPEIRLRIAPMEARTRKVLAVLIVAVALIVLFLMYWAITHATLI